MGKRREWYVTFGPRKGRAGAVEDISVQGFGGIFRSKRVMARETVSTESYEVGDGTATELLSVFVGRRVIDINVMTKQLHVGYGLHFAVDPALPVVMRVKFHRDAVWEGTLFGQVEPQ